jgi:two-component system sensor histidine kinase DesK
MVVQTVLNILACRWALTSMRQASKRPTGRDLPLLLVWAAVTLLLWVATAVLITDEPQWRLVVLAVIVAPVAAISPTLNRRWILICSLLVMAVLVLVLGAGYADRLGWGFVVGVSTGLAISVVAMIASFWALGWMLRVVWALDDARGQAAELAIAEERLRIARDLHDVFGRTLATVAVKSELAAELVRRGRDDEAAAEMSAVRAIADDAGREVRHVVRGVRSADLATELAGARALLDSAGIRCEVVGGPPATLDPEVAGALGWALREAVTNVIRHSRASRCRIVLTSDRAVRLQVENDGIVVTPLGDGGHGLLGIGERMAAVGGHVTHRVADGRFTLQVAAPLRPGLVAAR